jgi:tetratricopeptide (TPR) repeat protein
MASMRRRIPWIWILILGFALFAGMVLTYLGRRSAGLDPLERGLDSYKQGHWSAAADSARQRLTIDRDDLRAIRLLARSSVHLRRDQTAAVLFGKLFAPNGVAPDAEDYYLVGLALSRQHKSDDAIVKWEAGLKLDPERGEILDALARAYVEQNRIVEALSVAERLLNQPRWNSHAALMLGQLRSTLNDPAGAVGVLEPVVRDPKKLVDATSAPSLFLKLLARNLLQISRPADARAQLQEALSSGTDPEASWLLSRAFLQEGMLAPAKTALEQSGNYRAMHPLEPEPGAYVGESRCVDCHRDIFESTMASRHAQSLHQGVQLKKLPLTAGPLADPGDPKVTHEVKWAGNELQVETVANNQYYSALINYAFGTSDRYLTMVGRDAQGESRAVRISFHRSAQGSGWDLSAGDTLKPERELWFLGRPIETRQGAVRCLYCHATNVRGGIQRTGPESADHGIGCERCHGPGENHLKAASGQFVDMAIACSAQASSQDLTRLCNRCHSLHSPEVELEVPRTDPIWHRSPGVSFTWSRCSIESGESFNCLTCHDPHQPAETSPAYYEAKCLSCHTKDPATTIKSQVRGSGSEREESRQATTVCPENPTSDCLRCHMPRVRNEVLHIPLTDHYIRIRPKAAPDASAPG